MALAAFARFSYLYESSSNPTFVAPIVDSQVYDEMARGLAEEKNMTDEFFWQPFFYPFFLSLVYFLSNSSILCAKIIQALLGCVTCVLTYYLGKRVFGQRIGILAGVVTAMYGPLFFFETELVAAGWAAFWSVALILLFINTGRNKSLLLCFALGLCGALSTLTRPTFLPFFFAACLWLALTFYRGRLRVQMILARLLIILAGFSLLIVPVSIWNFRITRHFSFLPHSGGINFYIGNNDNYCQTLTARPGWQWQQITSLPAKHGIGRDDREQQRFFYQEVKKFALNKPLEFTKGLARKTLQLVNSREIPRNVDIYLFGKWSVLIRLLTWKVGRFGFPFGVIFPLAVIGLIYYWRRIPAPILLFILFYPISVILVFVTARYRTPIIPVTCILAAAGVQGFLRTFLMRRWSGVLVFAGCATGLVLLSVLPGFFCEEKPDYEVELYANAGATLAGRGKIDEAMACYADALRLDPNFPLAHANMGVALAGQGKIEQAIIHYEKALQANPNCPEVNNNLAEALARQGKINLAVKHYEKAIQLNPSYAEAHYNLGNVMLEQGKINQAVNRYKEALRIRPDYAKAHGNLAVAMASQGRFEEAVEEFRRALQLNPEFAEAHDNLGLTLSQQGKIAQAVVHYYEAIRLQPNWHQTLTRLAGILATSGNPAVRDPAQAIRLAERACQLTGYNQPEPLDTLAAACAAAGRFPEAVANAEKALELALDLKQEKLASAIRSRLKLYRAGQTYRPRPVPSQENINP